MPDMLMQVKGLGLERGRRKLLRDFDLEVNAGKGLARWIFTAASITFWREL